MRTSETTAKLAKALAAAQAEMKNAPLNKVNPHFKSKYADLSAVRDATVPALAKHGLALTQMPGFGEHGLVLYTRLSHADGEWIQAEYPLANGNPQQMGSALTYARRYCWAAICGIAADEDDDANSAGDVRPAPAATHHPREAPKLIELYDQDGVEYLKPAGEVRQWIKDAVSDIASNEELEALLQANKTNASVCKAIRQEADTATESPAPLGDPAKPAERFYREPPAQTARDRFFARLEAVDDFGKAAELDADLRKAERVLGSFYAECARAMQGKTEELRRALRGGDGRSFADDIEDLEPDEWKNPERRAGPPPTPRDPIPQTVPERPRTSEEPERHQGSDGAGSPASEAEIRSERQSGGGAGVTVLGKTYERLGAARTALLKAIQNIPNAKLDEIKPDVERLAKAMRLDGRRQFADEIEERFNERIFEAHQSPGPASEARQEPAATPAPEPDADMIDHNTAAGAAPSAPAEGPVFKLFGLDQKSIGTYDADRWLDEIEQKRRVAPSDTVRANWVKANLVVMSRIRAARPDLESEIDDLRAQAS